MMTRARGQSRKALAGAVAIVAVCLGLTGCSKGTPEGPVNPIGPTIIDVSGTWVQVGGGTRTWTLGQGSISIAGKATLAEDNHPHFGVVSASGGLFGAVIGTSVMFAETYESVSTPLMLPPGACYIETNGSLTINGDTMTGSYVETNRCGTVKYEPLTRSLTLKRQ